LALFEGESKGAAGVIALFVTRAASGDHPAQWAAMAICTANAENRRVTANADSELR
jgi:hypothetical protein